MNFTTTHYILWNKTNENKTGYHHPGMAVTWPNRYQAPQEPPLSLECSNEGLETAVVLGLLFLAFAIYLFCRISGAYQRLRKRLIRFNICKQCASSSESCSSTKSATIPDKNSFNCARAFLGKRSKKVEHIKKKDLMPAVSFASKSHGTIHNNVQFL